MSDEPPTPSAAQLHELLLLAANRIDQDRLPALRWALASGRLSEVVAALPDSPGRTSAPSLEYAFGPALRDPAIFGSQMPSVLDLTTIDSWAASSADAVDRAAARAAATLAGPSALWRAWRLAPGEAVPSVRIYLLLCDLPAGDLPGVTARMQDALVVEGVTTPQVEAFNQSTRLPPYQQLARRRAALLWTRDPRTPIRLAPLFDRVDPVAGPVFDGTRPRLDRSQADRALGYLAAGAPLRVTTQLMTDLLDRTAGDVVPMSYRTDGQWVWTEATAFYLRRHGVSPDEGLLAHMRTRDFSPPDVDMVDYHRAYAELMRPVTGPPAWTV